MAKLTPDQAEEIRRIFNSRATEELEQMQTVIHDVLLIRKDITSKKVAQEQK